MPISRLWMILLALALMASSASAFMVRSSDGRLWLTDRQPYDPNTKVVHQLPRDNEPARNQTHLQLFDVGTRARNEQLRRWVANSGKTCLDATSSYFQGLDAQQTAYWNVSCIHGLTYAIQVPNTASDTPKIMSCGDVKPPNTPCFTRLSRP